MKKSKLILSLAMMCLSIAVLCFGVLAAQSVNYTISGTISYEVNDAFVEMKTSVWYTEQYLKGQSLDVCDAFASNLPASGNTYGFVQDRSVTFNTFNSLNDYPDTGYSSSVNISLGTNKTAMIIVEVTNLGEKDTWVVAFADEKVCYRLFDDTNVYGHVNYIENLAKGQTMNFIIFMTPDNLANGLTDVALNVPIFCGIGDYVDFEVKNNFFNLENVAEGKIASNDCNEKGYVKIPSSITVDGTSYKITQVVHDATENGENFYAYNLDIPEGIIAVDGSIGECENEQLKALILPSTIQEFDYEYNCVSECLKLEKIVVKESSSSATNKYYTNEDNTVLYGKLENGNVQLIWAIKNIKTLALGGGVEKICDRALYKCSSLTSITIPDSVTSIEYQAFSGCESLTSITIPDSVTSIEWGAFGDCWSLKSVTFEDPDNWFVTSVWNGTSGTNLTLTNATTNATYLTNTYRIYYWKKSA